MAAGADRVKNELAALANPAQAKILSGFFKTGRGEYGEGDVFLGVKVPLQRKVASKHHGIGLDEIRVLLQSRIHEHRLAALLILVGKYKKADEEEKSEIYRFYLANAKMANNWDLVDSSAPYVVGEYLHGRSERMKVLRTLAKSSNLWERRIAILSTFAFIRKNRFSEALEISEMLLDDKHDLIHKAVGWMLREIGKRDAGAEEKFLEKNAARMPRTMLRYAVERFSVEKKRNIWG